MRVQDILSGVVVQFKAVENLHSAPSLHAENAAIYSRRRRGRSTLCLDARIMIRYVHYHQRMQLKCQPAAWRHISPFFTLSSSSSPLSFYNLTVSLIFQHIEPLTSTPLVRLRGSREPSHDSRISNCGNDNRSHCLSANNFLDPSLTMPNNQGREEDSVDGWVFSDRKSMVIILISFLWFWLLLT